MLAIAALTGGLAPLFSFNFVLLLPGLAAFPLLFFRRQSGVRYALVFAGISGLLVVGVTWLGYISSAEDWTLAGFRHWLTSHSEQDGLTHLGWSINGILRAVVGLQTYFTGPSQLTGYAKQVLTSQDELLPVRLVDILRMICAIGIMAMLGFMSLQVRKRTAAWPSIMFAAICIMPVFVFAALWLGSDPQFWIPAVPVVLFNIASVCGSGMGLLRTWARAKYVAFLLVAALLALNLPYPVPTLACPSGGRLWRQANALETLLGPGDLVIYPAGYPRYVEADGVDLLNLYYDGHLRSDPPMAVQTIMEYIAIRLARGDNVMLVETYNVESATALGYWQMIESYFEYDRRALISAIDDRFTAEPVHVSGLGQSAYTVKSHGH